MTRWPLTQSSERAGPREWGDLRREPHYSQIHPLQALHTDARRGAKVCAPAVENVAYSSFGVFLQRFEAGGAAPADASSLDEGLAPYVVEGDAGHADRYLRFSDGTADVFLVGEDWSDGFMVNHVSGREAWDVLFAVASRGHLAILPVGVPGGRHERRRPSRASGRAVADAVVLQSGAELLETIRSS